ncbi:MAG: penicillin acylase family protein [Planctomycetota bacterium]
MLRNAPLFVAAVIGVLVLGLLGSINSLLRSSIPTLDGTRWVSGLGESVEIARDARGVPVIRAATVNDAAFGTGFVHAQDRFSRMDILRRLASGELAAFGGASLVNFDIQLRTARMGEAADRLIADASPEQRALLEAYAAGVNVGLESLGARVPEHLLLGITPRPWEARDCALAYLAMTYQLSRFGDVDRGLDVMHRTLPEPLVEFLTPTRTRFDAPMLTDTAAIAPPAAIPGPDVIDLRALPTRVSERRSAFRPILTPGSNNWAVGATRSRDGRAILANDMHLGLQVPGTWYHLQLEIGDRRLVGVSFPGAPGIVVGSNGDVAWGFTNVGGDFIDTVVVETLPGDPTRYRVPGGSEPFEQIVETIEVRGGAAVEHTLRMTRWGAVTGEDDLGRPLVQVWTGTQPGRMNLAIFDLPNARSLEELIDAARTWKGPPQNIAMASADGRVAWVLAGDLPRRVGIDGRRAASWASAGTGWFGVLPEEMRSSAVDPDADIIFSANNRTMGAPEASIIGRNWGLGVRAARIAQVLQTSDGIDERTMLALQLDATAPLHQAYANVLGPLLPRDDDEFAALLESIESWDGTANADQRGFLAIEVLRQELVTLTLDPLIEPCLKVDPDFSYFWQQRDEVVLRLLEEQPLHLLSPEFASWADLVRRACDETVRILDQRYRGLSTHWGQANRAAIEHPVARLAGPLGERFHMPRHEQGGHWYTVRVSGRSFGASQRLVVSPGHEEDGILHLPGGQSGHFLSPHYADGHAAWRDGDPTPLLAGPAVHTLRLVPHAGQTP